MVRELHKACVKSLGDARECCGETAAVLRHRKTAGSPDLCDTLGVILFPSGEIEIDVEAFERA